MVSGADGDRLVLSWLGIVATIHSTYRGFVMANFVLGVISSIVAAAIVWTVTQLFIPYLVDRLIYKGIRVTGTWDIIESRDGEDRVVGEIVLEQMGSKVKGTSQRRMTREGQSSNRKFRYSGHVCGQQMTLAFEDACAKGFDSGTYVFRILNTSNEMLGYATFDGKKENRIVAEQRTLKKRP